VSEIKEATKIGMNELVCRDALMSLENSRYQEELSMLSNGPIRNEISAGENWP